MFEARNLKTVALDPEVLVHFRNYDSEEQA